MATDRSNAPGAPDTPPNGVLRLIVRDEIAAALRTHGILCPFAADAVEARLRQMEIGHARLIGLLIGSSLLGGSGTAALLHFLS
jgi:hypothetical protein